MNHLLLVLFWMLYVFLHSFLVTPGTKQQAKKWLGEKFVYYRLFYNIFSALTLALLLWFQLSIPTLAIFNRSTFLMIAGGIVSLAGLVMMLVCICKYFFSLSGLQELVLEQTHTSGPLLVNGLHRYVRHPLYLGTFLFIWGLWLVFPYLNHLLANIVITIYTLIGIKLEERKLISSFGDAYVQYKKRVPMIVPRLSP
ncbi:MAG: methyltransferase family protein [Flavisolibacter sp.]